MHLLYAPLSPLALSPLCILSLPSLPLWLSPLDLEQSTVGALHQHCTSAVLDHFLAVDLLDVLVEVIQSGEAPILATLRRAGAPAPTFRAINVHTGSMRGFLMTTKIEWTREGGLAAGFKAEVGFGFGLTTRFTT